MYRTRFYFILWHFLINQETPRRNLFRDDLDMQVAPPIKSPDPMELLEHAWCSTAIQVFEPAVYDGSMVFMENMDTSAPLSKSDKNTKVDDGELKSTPQWKFDDLKSWIWLQQAIHPELDYDLCFRKKWFSRKILPWKGISIKKWVKEFKQKRKEEERLRRAEVHAAISVAGVAAALAAIAAENAEPDQLNTLKETAMASAAALVAAQCAQVAEAVGANREQLTSAINSAMTATDASNIITLTAAAATSLKGAATLRGRTGHKERKKGSTETLLSDEFDFDFGMCRALLAKGDDLLVRTPDGKYRLRSVSLVLNKNAEVILKIKKTKVLMAFSSAEESIVYDLHAIPPDEPIQEADSSRFIRMTTSQGKIELKIEDYAQYKRWIMTLSHMLMLSTTFSKYELQFYKN